MTGDPHNVDLELVEHNLDKPNICGVVRVVAGRQWICVKPAHDDPPRRDQRSPWQAGYPPRSERHYFRRRYPHTDH